MNRQSGYNLNHKHKQPLPKWWNEAREKHPPEEIVNYLNKNPELLDKHISKLDNNSYIYRWLHRLFSLISRIAGIADYIVDTTKRLLSHFPVVRTILGKIWEWKNHLNFRETVEFIRTKIYSLKRPPHNENDLKAIEEIMEFSSKHGYKPQKSCYKKFQVKKNQMMQHKYFQEFSKSGMEKLLAVQFSFNRNIFPVLPDSAFWHKIFVVVERVIIIDIFLVDRDGSRISYKKSSRDKIESTDVIRTLKQLVEIKKNGRRIFIVGNHDGYVGPYFVRSVIRRLGFDILTKNCNAIAGPRVFSNIVLRNGAANVGNLFITVPSQKTTEIKTHGLADELRKTAKRTHCMVKMPDAGLDLIEKLDYNDFRKVFIDCDEKMFRAMSGELTQAQVRGLKSFLKSSGFQDNMKDFTVEDYDLFKSIMRETFLLFPEGSRSFIDPDGAQVMKYINPRYMDAYMRPGDYIAPISLVGGSDFTRGWMLRRARFGISLGEPFKVTAEMIKNYEEYGIAVMKNIAALPNIKEVRFKEEIQYKKKKDKTPRK